MAYNRDEILNLALEAIEKHTIRKISHILPYLPISHQTFYDWEFDKLDIIATKIQSNKIKVKNKMVERWTQSGNPALEIAAFKLLAEEDELEAVTTTKVKSDNTHTIQGKPTIAIDFIDGDSKGQSE